MHHTLLISTLTCGTLLLASTARSDDAPPDVLVHGHLVVPKQITDENNTERLLLLTPRGPLVVEVNMFVEGKPFRTERQRMATQMVQQADRDGDGRPTWVEALQDPGFGFGLLGYQQRTAEQAEQLAKTYDKNEDGLVDRAEARLMLAIHTGTGAFFVQTPVRYDNAWYGGGYSSGIRNAVLRLLDRDGDSALTPDEIDAAPQRLRSRDANDDDLLMLMELTGGMNHYPIFGGFGRCGVGLVQAPATAVLLGSALNVDTVYQSLVARYKNDDGSVPLSAFQLDAESFQMLADQEGELVGKQNLARLNSIEPHLRLRVDLGTGEAKTGISLVSIRQQLGDLDRIASTENGNLTLKLAGLTIQLTANGNLRKQDYTATADGQINSYDADNNKYLKLDELLAKFKEENQRKQMEAQFAAWDLDGNGMVFADEIKKSYEGTQLPYASRITAAATQEENKLFALLDTSADGRICDREMRGAPGRLRSMDADGDGRLGAEELPVAMSVSFVRGNATRSHGWNSLAVQQPTNENSKCPAWFTRMDRNGDGDVSAREFPGTADQFAVLDQNSDGFIDATEAANCEKP